MTVSRPRARAFTLVELLVVIGIIAVLIGVLLPVLSGVSARGRDVKCQSNLRQIVQATFNYCAEHKGSMPFGFYYNRSRNDVNPNPAHTSNDWEESPANVRGEYIVWSSQLGRYMNKAGTGIDDNETVGAALRVTFPPVLQCPEAAQARTHVVGYVMNFIVGISPMYERRIGGVSPRGQLRPPTQTLMLKETALFWDTGIRPNWSENSGHSTGADIDDERFWRGAHTPQYRYFTLKDVFGHMQGGAYGQNRPVNLDVGSHVFYNKDPNTSALERWPYQGNLRFRHNKNTQCNVAFADGSVRQFTAKMQSDPYGRVRSHDALRRYFMIKWPPGVPVNQNIPH